MTAIPQQAAIMAFSQAVASSQAKCKSMSHIGTGTKGWMGQLFIKRLPHSNCLSPSFQHQNLTRVNLRQLLVHRLLSTRLLFVHAHQLLRLLVSLYPHSLNVARTTAVQHPCPSLYRSISDPHRGAKENVVLLPSSFSMSEEPTRLLLSPRDTPIASRRSVNVRNHQAVRVTRLAGALSPPALTCSRRNESIREG